MPTTILQWFERNLRIAAIREMFSMVAVKRSEVWGLTLLALIYAFTEGVGLSVLLPVLQFAENGEVASTSGGGLLWDWPRMLAQTIGVPLNLSTLLIIAFIPVLLRQVTFYLNNWYSTLVSNRISARMRIDLYRMITEADPDFMTSRPHGDFTGAILGQTHAAGQGVIQVMRLLSIALQVIVYVTMLAYLSLPVTALAVVAGLTVSRLLRTSLTRTRLFGAEATAVAQTSYAAIAERLTIARLVKMRGEEASEVDNVARLTWRWAQANVAIGRLAGTIEVIGDPLLMLGAFGALYLGVAVIGLRLAAMGMLLYVLTRLNSKVKEFNSFRQILSSNMGSVFLVRDLFAAAQEADTIAGGRAEFSGVTDGVVMESVSFIFPGAESPVLSDVTAEILAGSFTAIVGRSGAGKSTLVELLPRLREATSGTVLYDGTDIREFDLRSLRRGIGYLTQDPLLFNDSVRANLVYGLGREATDTEITEALDAAHAQFARDLPEGLETRLGDRGVRLSGGERQRIALARVLLEKPSLLILDEPTSALDSESEGYIQETLASLRGTTTIIVIAHRLATVVAADQLLVMEDGRIVQRGTHRDLVSVDGPYKHLFESQMFRAE
ncbi:MAG: ABC transporter ATP-binding protein [Actinobacteria bacterium]|nr:ABC transporter ATP-binding protein [Actinomycetota bacterium]